MKKTVALFLTTALAFCPLTAMPVYAAGSVYELEQGSITDIGENETAVVSLTGASGGKAVDLKDAGDAVTVKVTAASAGAHTLTIRYCQPYDAESSKLQTVKVNGQNAGEIACDYTGENQFRTVSLSAELKAGENTVTIEGGWGWTYLDSLTVEGKGNVRSRFSPNPIISRGVPAYAGSGKAFEGNDDAYYTAWTSDAPDSLAYDLSGVPASQRHKVLAVWYNNSTFDRVGRYITVEGEPTDYTIEINRAPGGSCPKDGWEVLETVKGNTLSTRSHLLDMDGANWIRMRVTGAEKGISLNFDVHDASQGADDSWIFYGDSITAGGMGNAWGTSYASHVHALDANLTPLQQNGGIGGISSTEGREHIDAWLAATAAHYVSIAYGTNDSWGNMNSTELYYDNTKYMIDAVLNAGKIPVLPKIPYASNPDVGTYVGAHNAVIEQLYSEYGEKLVHGPDFERYFQEHPSGLSDDGVHPNADGYEAMRKLWAQTMNENVYTKAATWLVGDVDSDGNVTVLDAVMLSGNNSIFHAGSSMKNGKNIENQYVMTKRQYAASVIRNSQFRIASGGGYSPSGLCSGQPPLYLIPEGGNLFETLVMSLPCYDSRETSEKDLPLWEQPELPVDVPKLITDHALGYCAAMFLPTVGLHYGKVEGDTVSTVFIWNTAELYKGFGKEYKTHIPSDSGNADVVLEQCTNFLVFDNKKGNKSVCTFSADRDMLLDLFRFDIKDLSGRFRYFGYSSLETARFIQTVKNDIGGEVPDKILCKIFGLRMLKKGEPQPAQMTAAMELPTSVMANEKAYKECADFVQKLDRMVRELRYVLFRLDMDMTYDKGQDGADKTKQIDDGHVKENITQMTKQYADYLHDRCINGWLLKIADSNDDQKVHEEYLEDAFQEALRIYDQYPVLDRNYIRKIQWKGILNYRLRKAMNNG